MESISSSSSYFNGKKVDKNGNEEQEYFDYLTTFQNELLKKQQVTKNLLDILGLIEIDNIDNIDTETTTQDIDLRKVEILKDIVKSHFQK